MRTRFHEVEQGPTESKAIILSSWKEGSQSFCLFVRNRRFDLLESLVPFFDLLDARL